MARALAVALVVLPLVGLVVVPVGGAQTASAGFLTRVVLQLPERGGQEYDVIAVFGVRAPDDEIDELAEEVLDFDAIEDLALRTASEVGVPADAVEVAPETVEEPGGYIARVVLFDDLTEDEAERLLTNESSVIAELSIDPSAEGYELEGSISAVPEGRGGEDHRVELRAGVPRGSVGSSNGEVLDDGAVEWLAGPEATEVRAELLFERPAGDEEEPPSPSAAEADEGELDNGDDDVAGGADGDGEADASAPATGTAPGAAQGDRGGAPILWIVVVAVAVAVVIGLVILLVRRRRDRAGGAGAPGEPSADHPPSAPHAAPPPPPPSPPSPHDAPPPPPPPSPHDGPPPPHDAPPHAPWPPPHGGPPAPWPPPHGGPPAP